MTTVLSMIHLKRSTLYFLVLWRQAVSAKADLCTEFRPIAYSNLFGYSDFNVPSPTLVTLFFFNIIVIILLLNIIIAVMSDCYAELSASAELIFWDHRFELIVDVDAICNCVTTLLLPGKSPKKPKETIDDNDEEQDAGTISHDWFNRLLSRKYNSKIPNPIFNLIVFGTMVLWVFVGLCTIGITWPRHVRRKIFAPSVTDHLSEDDTQPEIMSERMRVENELLLKKNLQLSEEVEDLRKKLATFRNESESRCLQTPTIVYSEC